MEKGHEILYMER